MRYSLSSKPLEPKRCQTDFWIYRRHSASGVTERAGILLPPGPHTVRMFSSTQAGRVVRVSTNAEDGGDPILELFAVAVDDDQGALDAFHRQFAVYENGAEIMGPLRPATIALLTLTDGQATPL